MAYRGVVLTGSTAGDYGFVDAAAGLDGRLNCPTDLAYSLDHSVVYIADHGNEAIRALTMAGTFPLSTVCTTTGYRPLSLCVGPVSGALYFTARSTADRKDRLYKCVPGGALTVLYEPNTRLGGLDVYSDEAFLRTEIGTGFSLGDSDFTTTALDVDTTSGATSSPVGRGAFEQYGPVHIAPGTGVSLSLTYAGGYNGVRMHRSANYGGPETQSATVPWTANMREWNEAPIAYSADNTLLAPTYQHLYLINYNTATLAIDTSAHDLSFGVGLSNTIPASSAVYDETLGVFYASCRASINANPTVNTSGSDNGVPVNTVIVLVPRSSISCSL